MEVLITCSIKILRKFGKFEGLLDCFLFFAVIQTLAEGTKVISDVKCNNIQNVIKHLVKGSIQNLPSPPPPPPHPYRPRSGFVPTPPKARQELSKEKRAMKTSSKAAVTDRLHFRIEGPISVLGRNSWAVVVDFITSMPAHQALPHTLGCSSVLRQHKHVEKWIHDGVGENERR